MIGFNQTFRTGIKGAKRARKGIPNPLYFDNDAVVNGIGTKDSPLNSYTAAFSLAMGVPNQTLCIKASELNPIRIQLPAFESTENLTIRGWDSQPWYIYGTNAIEGWQYSGDGVWFKELDFTVVNMGLVPSMTETVGDREFLVKLKKADEQTHPDQGQIGYVDNICYLRLPNDENPNDHQIEVSKRNNALRAFGFATLTVFDVVIRGCIQAGIQNGFSTVKEGAGHLILNDSSMEYMGLNGVVGSAVNGTTVCNRVKSIRCTNDGFNHRRLGGEGIMTLNDCDGSYNGDYAHQSSQGCSAHGDSTMIVNGGRYNFNVTGGMVSINSSKVDIHGDTEFGPVVMNGNMRLGNTGAANHQAGCAWLQDCFGVVTGDVTVSNGQGRGVIVEDGIVQGVEAIKSINNALPDQI